MCSSKQIAILLLSWFLLFASANNASWAGPQDQTHKFPVGIEIGGKKTGAIDDTGGVTSLSFVDAKAAGLLDADGNPVRPPDGSASRGTGASFIDYNVFNNVTIKVTPAKADGTRNGDTREVTVTVFVPKKPADQTGATDAEKQKKTDSVINKLGANVAGMKIGGGKLEVVDTPTADPLKNLRSTEWSNAAPAPPAPPPPPLVPDHVIPVKPSGSGFIVPGVEFGSVIADANLTTLPVTLLPANIAAAAGLVPVGTETLDFDTQSSLFLDGYTNSVPGIDPLSLEFGLLKITLPALGGPLIVNDVAAFIDPELDEPLVGGNALVSDHFAGWLDSDLNTFDLAEIVEPDDIFIFTLAAMTIIIFVGGGRAGDPSRRFPSS